MDTRQALPHQQQLLAKRTALLAQIAEQRGGTVSRAEAAAAHFSQPEDSPAQLTSAKDIEFALGEHEVAELNALDTALARIEAGLYGKCVSCGIDIPEARLHASPEALRCIPCQEAAEKKHAA